MATNKDDGGCFATLLRHLLCRNGAPTHPSDTIGDQDWSPVRPHGRILKDGSKLGGGRDELGTTLSSGRRAGVVARLMGLETLPDTKWIPCSKSPDVFLRSRSVNFMDYLLEVDLSSRRAHRHRHRRAKTSLSFREVPVSVPTLLPPPKEKDFIVVIMEDPDEEADKREIEKRARPRKREANRRKQTEWSSKEKKVLKLRDEPRTKSRTACNRNPGQSNISARKSQRKDTWKQVDAVAADDADGSSPVSVLDKPDRHRHQGSNLGKSASARPSHKAGRHKSTSTQLVRTLDPVTSPEHEVPAKTEEMEFSEKSKHLNDAVLKAQMLAEEEAGRLKWVLPDLGSKEEICQMIEQHALNCVLEELVRISP